MRYTLCAMLLMPIIGIVLLLVWVGFKVLETWAAVVGGFMKLFNKVRM